MKIANEVSYIVRERTHLIDVAASQLRELRRFRPCPYRGRSEQAFVAYLPRLFRFLRDFEGDHSQVPHFAWVLFWNLGDGRHICRWERRTSLGRGLVKTTLRAYDRVGAAIPNAATGWHVQIPSDCSRLL